VVAVDLPVAVDVLVLEVTRPRLAGHLRRPRLELRRVLEDADRADAEDRVDRLADAANRATAADLIAARQLGDLVLVVGEVEPELVVERVELVAPVEPRLPAGVLHRTRVLRRCRRADERR